MSNFPEIEFNFMDFDCFLPEKNVFNVDEYISIFGDTEPSVFAKIDEAHAVLTPPPENFIENYSTQQVISIEDAYFEGMTPPNTPTDITDDISFEDVETQLDSIEEDILTLHLPPGGKILKESELPLDEFDNHVANVLSSAVSWMPELDPFFKENDISRTGEPNISKTKRKFEHPVTPLKKHKKKLETPLLQNLGGLQTVRVPNNFNEYDSFADNGNYIYEPAPRARLNCYEPSVIRKDLDKQEMGPQGLCPYCPEPNFLSLNTSAYLHHMTVTHGVFSNGSLVEEPGTCVEELLTNSGKREKLEFFICPYECELKEIKMKKINIKRPAGNRYKVYLRHVKDCHSCGKRDNQIKRRISV